MSSERTRGQWAATRDSPDTAALSAILIATLDADARAMNTQVVQRLAAGRYTARREMQSNARWRPSYPALATVMVAAIAVPLFTLLPFGAGPSLGPPSSASSDVTSLVAQPPSVDEFVALSMLTDNEDIDSYESVDFLLWLEKQRG